MYSKIRKSVVTVVSSLFTAALSVGELFGRHVAASSG